MQDELTIFLCRHGETPWTISRQHTGISDIPLTEKGKEQAERLGLLLKKYSFDQVYTSPLKRARQTCNCTGLDAKMILEPDAVEWNYGDYDGLTREEICKKNPSWDLFSNGAPGGESPQQISDRADRVIHRFLTQKGKIVLFSHGHFLRVLTARWLGLNAKDAKLFALSVASLSILGFEHRQRVLQLWNQTSENESKIHGLK